MAEEISLKKLLGDRVDLDSVGLEIDAFPGDAHLADIHSRVLRQTKKSGRLEEKTRRE